MLRDATHEPLINRTVLLQLDDEGVLHLHQEFLAGLIEGDALAIPGPLPTCESAGRRRLWPSSSALAK